MEFPYHLDLFSCWKNVMGSKSLRTNKKTPELPCGSHVAFSEFVGSNYNGFEPVFSSLDLLGGQFPSGLAMLCHPGTAQVGVVR